MGDLLDVMFIGLALSADSFSAALAMGFRPHTNWDSFKFASASGGAEGLVAFVGAIAGAKIVSQFASFDHWIAFGLLFAVAIHMFKEGLDALKEGEEDRQEACVGFHSFHKILIVSFATSLDALGVGVGLGVVDKPLAPYIVSIAAWAFASTLFGLFMARRVPRQLGPVFSFFGAGILVVLAFKMLSI